MNYSSYSDIRRLPVYLLLDCSSSMKGDALEAVLQGVKSLILKMCNDPHTCDIGWISIISFDSVPLQMIPLIPLLKVKHLPLSIGGCSNLGRALIFLRKCIDEEVRKLSENTFRRDWKPVVFLISDGNSTDKWQDAATWLKDSVHLIACGVGEEPAMTQFKDLARHVLIMKDQSPGAWDQLFDFLYKIIYTASQRSSGHSDRMNAPPIDPVKDKIVLY